MNDHEARTAGSVRAETSERPISGHMRSGFSALLLAGGLQPSPLREALRLPALCLPLTRDETLLDRWITLLTRTPGCDRVVIVVSTPADREAIHAALLERSEGKDALKDASAGRIDVRIDPRSFRGPSGIARDLADELGMTADDLMLIVEAACLPPTTLAPMCEAMGDDVAGVIGSSAELEPAGVYLFTYATLEQIPKVGFHDLKEQTLPMLYVQGRRCRVAQIVPCVRRLRDRASYLDVVELERRRAASAPQTGVEANLSRSARVAGTCLICDDVMVEDGVVLHESVVLCGAVIAGGAVVSRSVIGPGVRVPARAIIRGEVLPAVEGAVAEALRRRLGRPEAGPAEGSVNGYHGQTTSPQRGREDASE